MCQLKLISRHEDRRRGSVLVFVVGILLLLAVVATAFLSSSRIERKATAQHGDNTQADLLLEGVLNTVKGTLLSDARFNIGSNTFDTGTGFDSANADGLLAARVPVLSNENNVFDSTANPPLWTNISGPVFGNSFSHPYAPAVADKSTPIHSVRTALIPTTLTLTAGPNAGQAIPAFRFDPSGNHDNVYDPQAIVPALDADGDGIADAGMVQLPIGPVNGITYFCGVRVVDLNSAVNVNTAFEPANLGHSYSSSEYPLAANFFPSNVDLSSLLTGDPAARRGQMTTLNAYRTNTPSAQSNLTPVDDNGDARTEFTFAGVAAASPDAMWNQLGRRLNHPGINLPGAGASTERRYRGFGLDSAVALYGRFVVRNDEERDAALEETLEDSLKKGAAVKPYASGDTAGWFKQNFDFAKSESVPVDQTVPIRALLTTMNAVGSDNTSVVSAQPRPWQNGTSYHFGDVVTFAPADGAMSRNFVCIRSNSATSDNAPDSAAGLGNWGLLSWKMQSQKIDVNIADFGELWWGFRHVMAGQLDTRLGRAPNLDPAVTPYTTTTKGRQFRNPLRDPAAVPQFPSQPGQHLTPSEVLQLRTALAAVNAMDIRDSDTNISGRQITTYDFDTEPPVPRHSITVFGSEMQPYLTEIYYNNDTVNPGTVAGRNGPPNPAGYIAVELFNPYPVDLNLAGWALGLIDRSGPDYPKTIRPLLPVTRFPAHHFRASDRIIIPAQGHLVLENYSVSPTDPMTDAMHRPDEVSFPLSAKDGALLPAGAKMPRTVYRYLPQLAAVIRGTLPNGVPSAGGELVLLRPRNWQPDGTFRLSASANTANTADDAEDPHDEIGSGPANLADWVPVDSFDFSGMSVNAGGSALFSAWHYVRAHDEVETTWKCTHGGPYVPGKAGQLRQGEVTHFLASLPPTEGLPPLFPSRAPLSLGNYDIHGASFPDAFTGTQINGPGWPSPGRPAAGGGPNPQTPFGAFRLETDLLQVPFVGAYSIRPLGYTTGQFIEMNSMPLDWGFADDQDDDVTNPDPVPPPPASINNNAVEQVGRFCPLATLSPVEYRNWPNTMPLQWRDAPASPPDWYDFGANSPNPRDRHRTIFDVFTANSPLNCMLPAVSADAYANAVAADPNLMPVTVRSSRTKVAPGVTYGTAASVSGTSVTGYGNLLTEPDLYQRAILQVISGNARGRMAAIISSAGTLLTLNTEIPGFAAGDAFRILGEPDEQSGTEGLININTAPWPVLARLPFAFDTLGNVDRVASERMARRIVQYRDGDITATAPGAFGVNQRNAHGPFRSIIDLNKVLSPDETEPLFQIAGTQNIPLDMSVDYREAAGDLTPVNSLDGAAGDFETRYLALSRVANLITTRSDTFVAYVVLQGWRDAGTPNARMVTQRRAARIFDRSAASPASPFMRPSTIVRN